MNNQDVPDIKVTITHNDVKPPNYDIDALKKNIEDSKKHVLMLQEEIDKQQANQKELKKLIKAQEKRNSLTPSRSPFLRLRSGRVGHLEGEVA